MPKKPALNLFGIKLSGIQVIGILAIALIVLPAMGLYTIPGLPTLSIAGTGQDVSPGATIPTVPVECDSTTSPSITFSVFDAVKNGTSLSADYNQNVYINGVFSAEAVAGTAIAANAGDVITVYFEDKDATHDVYGFIEEYSVKCQETQVVNTTRGMQDGSLSTTVYQSDDITANTNVAAEAIGAGGTAEGRIRIKENTDDGYWSTTETGQKFLFVADVNSNAFSDFEVTGTSPSVAFSETSTPPSHTTRDSTNNLLTISTEIDGGNLVDLGKIDVYFRAPALSGINPNNDSNLLFTAMDKELYQNTNTGGWVVDYYNAVNNSDVGESNATDEYHIS